MEVFTPLLDLFSLVFCVAITVFASISLLFFFCFLFFLHSEVALQDLVRLGLRGSEIVIFMSFGQGHKIGAPDSSEIPVISRKSPTPSVASFSLISVTRVYLALRCLLPFLSLFCNFVCGDGHPDYLATYANAKNSRFGS